MFIVKPSRPGSIVAAAFAGLRADERRLKKIAKVYRAKDLSKLPPAPSNNAKPPRAKGGKPSKVKT